MSDQFHVVCPSCDAVNRLPRERLAEQPSCGKCHAALFGGAPVELESHNFRTHIERSDLPVVVDFWAAWCGPCKMMAPVFAQAAVQMAPMVRFAKVETDRSPDVASAYAIRSIPTMVLFRNGQERARTSGAMNLQGLVSWIERNRGAV